MFLPSIRSLNQRFFIKKDATKYISQRGDFLLSTGKFAMYARMRYYFIMHKKETATAAVRIYPSTRKQLKKMAKRSNLTLAEAINNIVKKTENFN